MEDLTGSVQDSMRQFLSNISTSNKAKERPLNILLLGNSFMGKSSFINLVHAALARQYSHYCKAGAFGGGRILNYNTRHLFRKKIIDDDDIQLDVTGFQIENINIPYFIDCPGLDLKLKADKIEELLTRLSYGAYQHGFDMERVLAGENSSLGVEEPSPDLQIDRVVLVLHYLPDKFEALINAIKKIFRPEMEGRVVPIFVVFTFMDTLEDGYKNVEDNRQRYEYRKNQIKEDLDLWDQEAVFVSGITNYISTSELGSDGFYEMNDKFSLQGLNALCKITNPYIKVINADHPMPNLRRGWF